MSDCLSDGMPHTAPVAATYDCHAMQLIVRNCRRQECQQKIAFAQPGNRSPRSGWCWSGWSWQDGGLLGTGDGKLGRGGLFRSGTISKTSTARIAKWFSRYAYKNTAREPRGLRTFLRLCGPTYFAEFVRAAPSTQVTTPARKRFSSSIDAWRSRMTKLFSPTVA